MTEGANTQAETPAAGPQPQRIKMSIADQAAFLGRLCARFQMRDGTLAREVFLDFDQDQMLRLETIWQTMALMEMHGADQLIRDKIGRDRRAVGRK